MSIPKIIHQTWKEENIPKHFQHYVDTWRCKHPHWQYILWTDKMNREYIEVNFPCFFERYDQYANAIQRVDAVRYFILYKMGGVFIDLDFECLKNIESLLTDGENVFGCEPEEHCLLHKKDMIISNAFMASIAGSEFIKEVCKEIAGIQAESKHAFDHILETTGPFMLTRIYKDYNKKDEVTLLSDKIMYPLTKRELERIDKDDETIQAKLNDAYAVHYYSGTWWKKSRR